MTVVRKLSFAGVLLLLPAALWAQVSTGKIVGTVQDSSGGVLPGVSIVIKSLDTGATRGLVTNERGQYEMPGLQPGRYQVEAELTGFRRYSQGPIIVQVNQETRVNITLTLGELAETLLVQAEGIQVQTTTATVGKVVDQKQIVELPLSGRNFVDLGLLTPGVTTRAQATSAGTTFIVHGQRDDANNFQLDGVANVTLGGNTLQARPNVDAVQEFKIQTSNFSAEFGRNSGSIVQVVTKSGTNDLHANGWEFVRNDKFQSKDYFLKLANRSPAPLRQNQFGATLGGPVMKNKMFFFGAYEGFRLRRGLTRQTVVATAQERAGDFSFLTKPLIDPNTGLPFPGNIITPERISPAARKLLTLMPLPNIPGAGPRLNNYVSSPSQINDYDQFMGRADHNLSGKWTLFYRHFLQNTSTLDPYQGAGPANYIGFPNQGTTRTQHGTAGVNTVFSSSVLNEFRVGLARSDNRNSNLPLLNPVDYGVNFVRPQDRIGGLGLPEFNILGMSGIGNQIQGPSTNTSTEYQVSNVLSKALGRHYLKMGGELRRGNENPDTGFFFVGRFVFNGGYTGDSLADFLLGRAVEFNYAKGRTLLVQQNWNYGAFFQDDFKLRDNLTLNVGVRYDYYSPINDALGQTSTFVVRKEPTPGVPQSGIGEVINAGTNGLPPKGTYFPDKANVQPRLGLAWDVNGNGKLAVRGGVGVFANQLRNNLTLQQLLSYPFYEQPVIRDTTLENPIKPTVGPPVIGQLYTTDPNIRTPYTVAYSVGYQWEFMSNTLLEMAYVGNQSHKLLQFREMNQPIYVPGQTTAANKDSFRPFPGFSSVLRSTNWGTSNYNGLETSVQRRFSRGLGFQVGWMWAKSLDLASQFHSGATNRTYLMMPQDDNNRRADYGPSVFDVRHRVVAAQIWDMPFGPGRRYLKEGPLTQVLGGWTLTSIWTFQMGFPYTIYDGSDRTRTAGSWTPNGRPNLVGDPNLPSSERTPNRWFNTSAFVPAPIGVFGNAGRNIVRGPGLINTDMSLIKRIYVDRVHKGFNLELRAEAFNIFNRVNFGIPVLDISSSAFGRISNTATVAREFQFGLKINY